MKVCSKCGIEKDESEFQKAKNGKNGLRSICKECDKQYRELRKENQAQYRKNYHLNNKDRENTKNKEYSLRNIDKLKQYRKNYYLDNKDKYIKNYKNNKEKKLLKQKILQDNRRKNDPKFKLKCNIAGCFIMALKRNSAIKRKPFFEYTGIAYADYITYFENNFPAEFAEITVKGKYHIDHIIPCAVYDFNNAEHIKLCWQPENLRIIPAKENLEKNDKLDFALIEKYNIAHLLPKI